MTDIYNDAYEDADESSYDVPGPPGPPSYYMSIRKQQQQPPTPKAKPTASSMDSELSPAVIHTDVKPSSIPMCRMFLIIIASLIIGGVIGGTFSYLLATRHDPVEGSSGKNNLTSASQCPTCPTCQTSQTACPTCQTSQTSCPTCPTSQASQTACPTCPTCQTSQTACPTCQTSQTACPTCPTSQTSQTCPAGVLTDLPRDCKEVMDRCNAASGEYMISPLLSNTAFPVWCDMETDGGGWTVFQRRIDGSVDFFLGWSEYTNGFGDVNSEHWLGNQKIHQITSQGDYELRIDMSDFEGNTAHAEYSYFKVGGNDTNYMLSVSGYSGDSGDSLLHHNNMAFTTKDDDNDVEPGGNCATIYGGAWWYRRCHHSNLNGRYMREPATKYGQGVIWVAWKGSYYSLKVSVMKMRRIV